MNVHSHKIRQANRFKENIFIWYTRKRGALITRPMVDHYVSIYNGKEYSTVYLIQEYMVGRRLGEFSSTRILHIYKSKKKKIKSKSIKSNA